MSASLDLNAFHSALRAFCEKHAIAVEEQALLRCQQHLQVLLKWNRVMNLVGDLSLQSAVERHYGEGLFLTTFLPASAGSVADIGSGGGFPGVPVAAQYPEMPVILIESRTKKATFLRESTRDWANVRVFCGLATEYQEPANWICSRGVNLDLILPAAKQRDASLLLLVGTPDLPKLEAACGSLGYTTRGTELPWRPQASVFIATPSRGFHVKPA